MDINDKVRWSVQSRDCIRSQPRTESHSILLKSVNLSPYIWFSRMKSSFACAHNDPHDDNADRNKPSLEWLSRTRHTFVYLLSQLVYRGAIQSLPSRWDAPNCEMRKFLQKWTILALFQSNWPRVNIEAMFQKRVRNRSIVNFFVQVAYNGQICLNLKFPFHYQVQTIGNFTKYYKPCESVYKLQRPFLFLPT